MPRSNIEVEISVIDKASKLAALVTKELKKMGATIDEATKKERAQAKETERLAKTFGTAEFKARALEKAEKNLARTQLAAAIRKQEKAFEATAIAAGKLTRATSRYNREAKKTEIQNKKTKSSFSRLGTAAMKVFFIYETGLRIARIAMRAFITPMVEAIKSFQAFEKGMAEVKTLFGSEMVAEASAIPQLTKYVEDLSIQMGKMPVDTAKALYFVVSAGATDAAAAQNVLRSSMMLSTAGLVDAETSAKALVTVMNAFGVPFENAERVANLFFITVQKGITTVKDLANKIGRVAGMAGAAGMDMEAMFAFIAAGTKVTGLTAATITGLRSAIKLLLNPGKTAIETFDRLNVAWGANALTGRKFIDFIQSLKHRLNSVNPAIRITTQELMRMIPNQRANAVILALLKTRVDDVGNAYTLMKDKVKSNGVAVAATNKIMETSAFKLEQLKATFEVLKVRFGEFITENAELGSIFEGMSIGLMASVEAFREIAEKDKEVKDLNKVMSDLGESAVFFGMIMGTVVLRAMMSMADWLGTVNVLAAKLSATFGDVGGLTEEPPAWYHQLLATEKVATRKIVTGRTKADVRLGEGGIMDPGAFQKVRGSERKLQVTEASWINIPTLEKQHNAVQGMLFKLVGARDKAADELKKINEEIAASEDKKTARAKIALEKLAEAYKKESEADQKTAKGKQQYIAAVKEVAKQNRIYQRVSKRTSAADKANLSRSEALTTELKKRAVEIKRLKKFEEGLTKQKKAILGAYDKERDHVKAAEKSQRDLSEGIKLTTERLAQFEAAMSTVKLSPEFEKKVKGLKGLVAADMSSKIVDAQGALDEPGGTGKGKGINKAAVINKISTRYAKDLIAAEIEVNTELLKRIGLTVTIETNEVRLIRLTKARARIKRSLSEKEAKVASAGFSLARKAHSAKLTDIKEAAKKEIAVLNSDYEKNKWVREQVTKVAQAEMAKELASLEDKGLKGEKLESARYAARTTIVERFTAGVKEHVSQLKKDVERGIRIARLSKQPRHFIKIS